jgi:hypothetical protein
MISIFLITSAFENEIKFKNKIDIKNENLLSIFFIII